MDIKVSGRKVTITFDMSAEPQMSKSGKSLVVASTHGFVTVPGRNEKLSLNMICPLD